MQCYIILISDSAGCFGHPARKSSQRSVVTMTKAIATKTEVSAKEAKSQLDIFAVRMTVALLNRAVNDVNADALTLWRVADLTCRTLKDLRQTEKVNEALRWANRAMAYDDDAVLTRWCLLQALEALTM